MARVSSCQYLPWMIEVIPSTAYRETFFHTFRTEPHVVSTSVHPRATNDSRTSVGTPKAGRITTSALPTSCIDSPGSVRKRMP